MGTFDDDSSGEGTGGTKESSKSSKKSRRTKEDSDNINGSTANISSGKTRKKKTKRKSNIGSEAGDKGKKRSGGKKRSSSKTKKATVAADGDDDVDRPIQDSIKTKQTLNGSGGSKRLERDVSFSRSTIARDIGHQSEMDIAMGKIPKPAAVAAAQDDNTMAAMELRKCLLHTRLCSGYWPVPLACPPCDLGSPIVGIRLKGVWALWAKGGATTTGQTYTCRLFAVTFF